MTLENLDTGVLDEMDLTEKERRFLETSVQDAPRYANWSRNISEFYLATTLRKEIKKMIESNKKLAISNDKHAKVMTGLTWALLFFAAVEAIATLVSALTAMGIIAQ